MGYPVWAVMDQYGNLSYAFPLEGGKVRFFDKVAWTRAEWREFKSQVEELYTIAEK